MGFVAGIMVSLLLMVSPVAEAQNYRQNVPAGNSLYSIAHQRKTSSGSIGYQKSAEPRTVQNVYGGGYSSSMSVRKRLGLHTSELNEQGIAVMPQADVYPTAIRRAVIPNPDENDEDLNQGDSENGSLGDALFPLLLMAGAFVFYRRRKSIMCCSKEK